MASISKYQITAIHIELSKSKMKDEKEAIVSQYTNGRTTSTLEMKKDEAFNLINYLKSLDGTSEKANKMRRKILSLAHEMAWKKEDGRVDMEHVNNWCQKSGYLHKKLDRYSYQELPALVTQFEKVYKDFINKV